MSLLRGGPLLVFAFSLSSSAQAVTSAELYRTAPLGFGKFEARIQFAAGDGVISSFFLWKDGSEMSDVYWNELDFEKLGADCDLQTNSIFGLPQTNHEGHDYGLSDLCEGYHTYGYEWTPDYISWLVDGTEIRRDTGADATAYADNAQAGMQVRFNVWPGNASFGGNFDEASLPVYQFVAWAQFSEYTPGAGDDGSDFTLAWREEFDAAPAGWAMASWDSPLGLSTHSSQNVAFVDGVAVLALTADDATGYDGTPPHDDLTGSTGGGSMGGAAVGGAVGTGGSPAASGGSPSGSGGSGPGAGGSSPPSGGAPAAGTGSSPGAGGSVSMTGGASNGVGAAASTGGSAAGPGSQSPGGGCSQVAAPLRASPFQALSGLIFATALGLISRRRRRLHG